MDKYQFLEARCQDAENNLLKANLSVDEFEQKYGPIRKNFWSIQEAKDNPMLDAWIEKLLRSYKDHPDFKKEWLGATL